MTGRARCARWSPYRSRRSTTRRPGWRRCAPGCGERVPARAAARRPVGRRRPGDGAAGRTAWTRCAVSSCRPRCWARRSTGYSPVVPRLSRRLGPHPRPRARDGARQRAGRAGPAVRPRALVPDARPARAAGRREDRTGGAGQPFPPPDVGVTMSQMPPAGLLAGVPELRGTAGGGRPVLRRVRLRPVGRARAAGRPSDGRHHGARRRAPGLPPPAVRCGGRAAVARPDSADVPAPDAPPGRPAGRGLGAASPARPRRPDGGPLDDRAGRPRERTPGRRLGRLRAGRTRSP